MGSGNTFLFGMCPLRGMVNSSFQIILFFFFGAVFAAGLFPVFDTGCVLGAANNVIANSGKVSNPAAADQDNAVFL
jgi:hypothetical protein